MTKQIFNPLLESNFQKIGEAPYSIIIYKKGSNTYAEDKNGKIVSSNSDSTVVFQAAIDYLTSGGIIFVSRGSYSIGNVNVNQHGIQLIGEGVSTKLYSNDATANIFSVSKDGILISNFHMSAAAGVTKTAGFGIVLNSSANTIIENIYVDSLKYWLDINGASGTIFVRKITLMEMATTASCVLIRTTGSGIYFNDCQFQGTALNPLYRGYRYYSGNGIWMTDCDVFIANVGIIFQPGAGQMVNNAFIKGCSFDSATLHNIYITSSGGGQNINIHFIDCWGCGSTGGHGVSVDDVNAQAIWFIGGFYSSNLQHGMIFTGGKNIHIRDVWATDNDTANTNSFNGISFGASMERFSIIGCVCTGAYHYAGILISNGCTIYQVCHNDCTVYTTLPIADNNTVPGRIYFENLGYNPRALAAIVVGASPFTYTNNSGYIEQIRYFSYSTTALQFIRAGVTTAIPSQANTVSNISLYPGDALRWTYSSTAPVIFRIPM